MIDAWTGRTSAGRGRTARAAATLLAGVVLGGIGMPLAAADADALARREARRVEAEARREAARTRREQRQADRDARSQEQRDAREARNAERDDWCRTLHAWAIRHDGVPPEVVQARFGGGGAGLAPDVGRIRSEAWAFQDDRLRALVGKTFDELGDAELEVIARRGNCRFGPATRDARPLVSGDVFTRAQHARFRADAAADIATIRKAHADAATSAAELAALSPDAAGAQRHARLVAAAAALRPMLDEPRRQTLAAALESAEVRVVAPVLAQRAQAAAASAHGLEGLALLAGIRRELADRRGTSAAVRTTLDEALQRVAGEVAADERQRLAALGGGVAGLERGVQWLRDYQQRIAPHAPDVPALRALPAEFEQRRGVAYEAARAELVAQIGRTQSDAELEQWAARVTLPGDARHAAGAAVLARLDERRALFERNRVLGRAPTEAARAEPTRAAAGADPAAAPRGAGEPSEEDIYQAVNDYYRGVSANMKDIAERCNSSAARNDPLLAMQCLGLGGAVGVGRGGTIQSGEVRLARLRKIGCAPAAGQPGWVCDFVAGIDSNLAVPPSMQGLLRNGSSSQARFVRVGDAWQVLPANRSQ